MIYYLLTTFYFIYDESDKIVSIAPSNCILRSSQRILAAFKSCFHYWSQPWYVSYFNDFLILDCNEKLVDCIPVCALHMDRDKGFIVL